MCFRLRAVQVHATLSTRPCPSTASSPPTASRARVDTVMPLRQAPAVPRCPPCTELRRLNALLLSTFGRLVPALADAASRLRRRCRDPRALPEPRAPAELAGHLEAHEAHRPLRGAVGTEETAARRPATGGRGALSAAVPRAEAQCDAAQRRRPRPHSAGPPLAAEDDNAASAASTSVA